MSSNAKLVAALAALVIVSIALVKFFAPSQPVIVQQPPLAATSLNPFVDAQLLKVAKQFKCSCGNCGGTPLEECSCPTAEKERAFIASQLRNGKTVEQTVALVDSVYGWRKDQLNAAKENS